MDEDVLVRVGQMTLQGHADRVSARGQLLQLWREIGGVDGDPVHQCAVAHALADVQDDIGEELRWDLAALDAAGDVTDERLTVATDKGANAGLKVASIVGGMLVGAGAAVAASVGVASVRAARPR